MSLDENLQQYYLILTYLCYRYGSNISTGLFLEAGNVNKIVEGKNEYWFHLKSKIKNHLGCVGDNAKTHVEALKVEIEL